MSRKELTTIVPESGKDGAVQVEMRLPGRQRRHESRNGGQPGSVTHKGRRPRIPRITPLMALAIKFQDMVDRGEVRDFAELARLGYVSRARLTQIMNLCHLAPDIQGMLLDDGDGRHVSLVTEKDLREVSRIVCWDDQRQVLSQID